MKKSVIFAFVMQMAICLSAQDITISFQPKVAGTQIDSIWVTNQRTNQKVQLLGNESLTLTKVTGITDLLSASEKGYLFPNPCNGKTQFSFTTALNQVVKLNVYNISGQLLSTESQFLIPGQYNFQIAFPGVGIYNVLIHKGDGSLNFKAICLSSPTNSCGIFYLGSEYQNLVKTATLGKTLSYAQGDILLHSVFSGKNNTIITDSPTTNKVYSVEFYACIDPDNNSYPIVKIGTQWWIAKNLAYLPSVSPSSSGTASSYYYVYDYNETDISAAKATSNFSTYGVLYNWPAALTACPEGWHLPSDDEWTILTNFLKDNGYGFQGSGDDIAKSLAAATHWKPSSDTGHPGNDSASNNSSGFSGLPGGTRSSNGNFNDMGYYFYFWSSTESSTTSAWYRRLYYKSTNIIRISYGKEYGFSVRCVRDL